MSTLCSVSLTHPFAGPTLGVKKGCRVRGNSDNPRAPGDDLSLQENQLVDRTGDETWLMNDITLQQICSIPNFQTHVLISLTY